MVWVWRNVSVGGIIWWGYELLGASQSLIKDNLVNIAPAFVRQTAFVWLVPPKGPTQPPAGHQAWIYEMRQLVEEHMVWLEILWTVTFDHQIET